MDLKKFERCAKPAHIHKCHSILKSLTSGEKTVWELGKRLGFSKHAKNPYFSIGFAGTAYRIVVQVIDDSIRFLGVFTHQQYTQFISKIN